MIRGPLLNIRLKSMILGLLLRLISKLLSACRWKSHNTFTQFYLKDVAWDDSGLFDLGPVVAAQQIHHEPS